MTLRVRVLGPLEVEVGGRGRPVGGVTQRTALGLLLCGAGQVVSVDRLIDGVWGDHPPGDPQHALQGQMSRIRRTFDGCADADVVRAPAGYRLELPDGCLDAAAFTAAAHHAEAATAAGDLVTAGAAAEAGMRLWRASPYHDVRESPATRAEIIRLEELRLRLLEVRAEASLVDGSVAETIPHLAALRDEHPYRERLWLLLARALDSAGRHHEALVVLRDLTTFLRDELGTDPSPDAADLHARLLQPDRTSVMRPAGARDRTDPIRTLPTPLAAVSTRGWAGRDAVTTRLVDVWRTAKWLKVALVSGEAGIGKTRLAAEVARAASADGARILYGGCTRDVGMPYEPLVDALDDDAGAGWLRGVALPGDSDAGQFVTDPGARRQQFAAAIGSRLSAAGDEGVVVVLDDLHWSDRATLDVVWRLARRPPPGRILVLGTYRDTDVDMQHPLIDVLADLRRTGLADHVMLEGLDVEAVRELLQHGATPRDPSIASRIHQACGGNPLFVTALIDRLDGSASMAADGTGLPIPEEIRDVVSSRFGAFDQSTTSILEVAAILGPVIDVSLLATAVEAPVDEVIAALDHATAGRVVRELAVGRYCFSHDIVRSAIEQAISRTRRARLHLAIADTLEARDARPADIARHLVAAGDDPPTLRRAAAALIAAGQAALAASAAPDSIGSFTRALDVTGRLGDESLSRRARLGLGIAQRDVGDPAFRQTLLDVARDAERAHDDDVLIAAAIDNHRGMWSSLAEPDHERIAVVDRAIGRCTSDVQRARLLARTAIEVVFVEDRDPVPLLEEAATLTQRTDDPRIRAEVLFAWGMAGWRPENAATLHVTSAELVALTERIGDRTSRTHALMWHSLHLRTIGATQDAREVLEAADRIAEAMDHDTLRLYVAGYSCAQAMLEGDVTAASAASDRARELGEATGQPDAMEWYLSMFSVINILAGRVDELVSVVRGLPAHATMDSVGPYRAFTSVALLRSGQALEGHRMWAQIADTLADAPRDFTWLQTVCVLALGADDVDDPVRCQHLHDLAAPFAGQFVNGGVVMWGTVDHTLGVLASAAGDAERAVTAFERATRLQEGAGAAGWQIHTQLAWARHLRRANPDSSQIGALLEAAEVAATRTGYPALAGEARQLRS